ncbi:MAG: quinone oxidoreductase [Spirochaetaceae bacterium]|nr:quinone oxidoreductase [Spirochaetaceae bacterium]
MKAIVIEQSGGPEVLAYRDAGVGEPAAGQVRVRVEAAGVNYIDTYQRSGLYPMPLPFTPGVEGAGVVDAVGDGVEGVAAGDRVVYVMTPGSYAELALVPAANLVTIPEGITTELAGAVFLQGLTAHYLSHSTYPLSSSSTCLVLAAAGGVGLLLSQIARHRGARVIGCVSSDAKAELARRAGCHEVIRYDQVDFKDEVMRLTDGRGVQVAYDSVAAATWQQSLGSLAPRGYLVLYGNASGPVTSLDPRVLNEGSYFVTRPTLTHYVQEEGELRSRADDLFGWMAAGELDVRVHKRYPLRDAAQAHRDIQSRATSGKLLIIP